MCSCAVRTREQIFSTIDVFVFVVAFCAYVGAHVVCARAASVDDSWKLRRARTSRVHVRENVDASFVRKRGVEKT
jgi:hypothetical protein